MTDVVKGIKLNNLLNIRLSNDKWQGATYPSSDSEFVQFNAPKWGIRAAARIVILHQDRLGKGTATVRELISSWAPPTENNTEAYINFVCDNGGFTGMTEYDFTQYDNIFKLIRAQIQMEVGLPGYDKATIDEGLKLAGIQVPVPSAMHVPAITVGATTAVLGAATPALQAAQGVLNSASPFAPALISVAHAAPFVIGIVLMVGAGYLIWHEIQKRSVQK